MRSLLILLLLFPFSSFGWEAQVELTDGLEMKLKISCETEESLCKDLCENETSCLIEAGSCNNCIGANSFISHFYREVGRLFQSTGRLLNDVDAAALLTSRSQFIFLEAQGPFNIYTGIGDLRTERHFESLCQGQFFSRPIVLAKLDLRSRVERASHVICHGDFGAEIFEMSHAGD
jgi:hypothetical protein